MKHALLYLALLASAGCASTRLTPQAEGVRATTNSEEVRNCKPLGDVEAHVPFPTPSDPWNQLKNATATLGGNVVLRTRGPAVFAKTWTGVAYLCEQPKP